MNCGNHQMKLSAKVFFFVILFGLFSSNAYAYLDPGTGSILFQGLVAALATGLATAKFWWHRVTSIFSSSASAEESQAVEDMDQNK